MIEAADLRRYRLEGVLGEGAEQQVFAATDAESGLPVVVRRPHPTLMGRLQHRDIEERIALVTSLRSGSKAALPHLPRLLAHSPDRCHDQYFGDSPGHRYTVTVEERARGVPLVGSVVDQIKGLHIGVPQNLFVLHPLVGHARCGILTVLRQVLELAEAVDRTGHLILDVRPENVFFDPRNAAITVVDLGNLGTGRPGSRRHSPVDWHDFYVELFKWYASPGTPPDEASSYAAPQGTGSVSSFERDVESLLYGFRAAEASPHTEAALEILGRVRQRRYGTLGKFRRDLERYLSLVARHYETLARSRHLVAAWREALGMLSGAPWDRFLFDPQTDLAPYRTA